MNKLIVVDEEFNLVELDISKEVWFNVIQDIFPNYSNQVKTPIMRTYFGRSDVVMLTHDLFTDDMELNIIGTTLYSGDQEAPIAGEIAFAKEYLNDEWEPDLCGLDTENADSDVKEQLEALCNHMKKVVQEQEVER